MSEALAYYNDNEPFVAEWLRNLVAAGELPAGDVDERDIRELKGTDLERYRQVHLFAGIGGWPLVLRLAGWPEGRPVWTGSCPCQPFSCAGKRRGEADERHLWPAFRRLIAECRPATVFGEQVASRDGRAWLSGVRADLEGVGYAVGAADLCAASVGAPHIRQRLFWVADTGLSQSARQRQQQVDADRQDVACGLVQPAGTRWHERRQAAEAPRHRGAAVPTGGACGRGSQDGHRAVRQQGAATAQASAWGDYTILSFADGKVRRIEAGTFPLAHGIPGRVGLLRGYGNAIVPQVAAAFVRAFLDCGGGR